MRRVLVPLDGSALAESIYPEARHLAGPGGELILVREANRRVYKKYPDTPRWQVLEEIQKYLEAQAEPLRADGMNVQTVALTFSDVARGIDETAEVLDVDMIACATHGRGPLGRLVHGAVAWKALAHSTVPVLLRHPEEPPTQRSQVRGRKRIMVPLDGSHFSEKALPLAQQLGLEWDAPVYLVRIVPDIPFGVPYMPISSVEVAPTIDMNEIQRYLDRVAGTVSGDVHTCMSESQMVADGSPRAIVDELALIARQKEISHIVIASHGRTALSRVIVGSVTDTLIQHLHYPIIVIPALASIEFEGHQVSVQEHESAVHA